MALTNLLRTRHHHQQIYKTKIRIRQQILQVRIMRRLTLVPFVNPQQQQTGQEATMQQLRLKIGIEISQLRRQHNRPLRMLIQMRIGQSVTTLLVSLNTLNLLYIIYFTKHLNNTLIDDLCSLPISIK